MLSFWEIMKVVRWVHNSDVVIKERQEKTKLIPTKKGSREVVTVKQAVFITVALQNFEAHAKPFGKSNLIILFTIILKEIKNGKTILDKHRKRYHQIQVLTEYILKITPATI